MFMKLTQSRFSEDRRELIYAGDASRIMRARRQSLRMQIFKIFF